MAERQESPETAPPGVLDPETLEMLSRELCAFHGHDPDALVFPGHLESIRTASVHAVVIPTPEKLIPAWNLFQGHALAAQHLQRMGLI